jgi:putative ABC transport system permease protein
MSQSLRLAVRTLLTNKPFTAAAVATLALGIAATTTMFSVTYGVLLRPLPYPEPDRIVKLWERRPGDSIANREALFSNISFHGWNGKSRTIGLIGSAGAYPRTVGLDEPTRLVGSDVSPEMFGILGVVPMHGRFFTEEDTRDGAPPVVVLSERLWRERFGGDLAAIGKTLPIDRQAHLIVGITPSGFAFPREDVRYWTTSTFSPLLGPKGELRLRGESAYARLLPGVSVEQAAAEGTAVAKAQTWPSENNPFWGQGAPEEILVRSISAQMTAAVRPVILLLFAGAGCLLLIACANAANLLLSRGSARARELGVMAALGATRARIVTQLLTEGVLIATLGGILGVSLAGLIIRLLPTLAPIDFPKIGDVRIDWTMAIGATLISLFAGVAAGLLPALRGGRHDLMSALRTTGASSSRQTARSRRTLLFAEAALAMALVALATVVGRGFVRLLSVDPGYRAEHVLSARVFLPGELLKRGEADLFASALLERVRGVPMVRAAGAGWMAPFGGSTSANTFTLGAPGREKVSAPSLVNVVTPGYAEALGLQLRAGRLLTEADLSSPLQSVVINEEFARTFFPGFNPIGLNLGVLLSRGVDAEVVGIVGNVLKDGLNTNPRPEVYLVAAHRYSVGGEMKLVIRTDGDPVGFAAVLRQFVRELRTDTALDNVVPLASQVSDSIRTERLAATTMGSFAVLATILAAVGLYGVLSYNVATRRREIGIRSALGADARDITWLVVRDGLGMTSIGLLVGLTAAVGGGRLLQSALFGIQPLDPVAVFVAPLVLLAVALAACLMPARRATRIDPVVALRAE